MDDFKPMLDDATETFGGLEKESSDVNLTIHLNSGDTIECNTVGINPDQNICRYFTWETLTKELIRDSIEGEDITFEEVTQSDEVEMGSKFLLMDGLIPWDSVSYVESDTDTMLG